MTLWQDLATNKQFRLGSFSENKDEKEGEGDKE